MTVTGDSEANDPTMSALPLIDRDGIPLDFPRRRGRAEPNSTNDVAIASGDRRSGEIAAILRAVESVPRGNAVSYGDIAAIAGLPSARLVGRVLARFGSDVPWHRVVMADGSPARHLAAEQLALLREEHVALVTDGTRVDLRVARPANGTCSES